jgi:hypothetical protein
MASDYCNCVNHEWLGGGTEMYGTDVRSPLHVLKMNSVPTSLLFRIHETNGNIELTCCVVFAISYRK